MAPAVHDGTVYLSTVPGNNGGFSIRQSSATGYAVPIDTALSVAQKIEAGQASSTISIGYPPFLGVYIGQGSDANPQDQSQQGSSGFGGSGGSSSEQTSEDSKKAKQEAKKAKEAQKKAQEKADSSSDSSQDSE